MPVNSQYLNPQITFASTPVITMQTSDTVELHFTPLANFFACNRLQLWRNIANSMSASLSQTTSFYQYTLPSSNAQYTFQLTLNPVCTYVLIPES